MLGSRLSEGVALPVGVKVGPDREQPQRQDSRGAIPAQGDRVLDQVDARGGVHGRNPDLRWHAGLVGLGGVAAHKEYKTSSEHPLIFLSGPASRGFYCHPLKQRGGGVVSLS